MIPSRYRESDLHFIWERQRFRRDGLLTEDARRVVVEHPGWLSVEGGPDFRAARLQLGGERVQGDVEIHLTPSGWRAHGHDRDGAYAGVVLHVVLRRNPFVDSWGGPPILVLEPHLLASPVDSVAAGERVGDLDREGDAWFADRRARMVRALERADADEVLYRETLVALGYKHNKAAMAEVARRCPLGSLGGSAGEIEARLRRAADRVPPAMWRLRNVRPANHPRRRLAGMARFLAAAREEGLARGLGARPTLAEMIAWLDPDGTGLIGPTRAREIALNVFVPFLGAGAWRRVAEGPPPERPGRLVRHSSAGVTTVRRYFGALRQLKRL